ncbi:MAG: hypothetical protein R3C04_07355 [Hyphomonas sp.]
MSLRGRGGGEENRAAALISRFRKPGRRLTSPVSFAFGYPVLGGGAVRDHGPAGHFLSALTLHWWYFAIAAGVIAFTIFRVQCQHRSKLHRILRHRAGELAVPGQVMTMVNLMIAIRGQCEGLGELSFPAPPLFRQARRPAQPVQIKRWAWVGWILWRDKEDTARPLADLAEEPARDCLDGPFLQ